MQHLEMMHIFATVAELEGFAKAARTLGISPSSATRAVSQLEAELGAPLLRRTTRVVKPTEAGRVFLEHYRAIAEAVEVARIAVQGTLALPRGEVAVTAPVRFGHDVVEPILLNALERYPEVTLRLLFVDRVVDLVEEGVDVAVRIGKLKDSSLKAVRVTKVSQILCASPGYLERRGEPTSVRALERHDAIWLPADRALHRWEFRDRASPKVRVTAVRPRIRVSANTVEAALQAAEAGFGVVRVLSYQARDACQSGRLQRILRRAEPEALPVSVVYPAERRVSAKVRRTLDCLIDGLRRM